MTERALARTTWPRVVLWDDMRTVSYVAARPDVDSKRIWCICTSMVGYGPLFLSALDQGIRDGLQVRGAAATSTWPDVAALAAPRALMVQQYRRDRLFPLDGMQAAVAGLARSFDKAGCSANLPAGFMTRHTGLHWLCRTRHFRGWIENWRTHERT